MITVLVVDDDAAMRRAIVEALSAARYRTCEAADGVEALAVFADRQPDVVITDIFMPEKNGIELVREIRALAPDTRLIAISGGGVTGEVRYLGMMRHFGVDDILEKPFRIDALLAIVARVLKAR